MRFPQLVIYENDGRLKGMLEATAAANRWALRVPQMPATCLRLLRRGGPAVFVLRMGRDPQKHEVPLLEQVTWLCPDVACVVVSDLDNPALGALAWDLGARFVLFPPHPRDQLPDVVAGLMGAVTPARSASEGD
jgi:hypothetical protein